ncbi:unnamed protein product [Ixodes hexagonus]
MEVLVPFLSLLALCCAEDDAKLTAASNNFGLRLFPLLPSSPDENVFFSPYSLSIAMGMAYAGARADTEQELYEKLGYANAGLTKEQVLPAFASQTQKHKSAQSNTTVDVANSAALHLRLPLLDEYENALRNTFNAELQKVDFEEAGQAAIDVINHWVKEKTHDKIEKLFSEPLSPLTRFVLLNAIYFKGAWETEFEKRRTEKKPFWNGGVTQAEVDTMFGHIRIRHNSFPDLGVDVAELPYRGGDYSMVILLPQQNTGVEALKTNLTAHQLNTLLDELVERPVDVSLPSLETYMERYAERLLGLRPVSDAAIIAENSAIPVALRLKSHASFSFFNACFEATGLPTNFTSYRFKLETQYSLKDTLHKMGITRIFDEADLSGITGDTSLRVSDVVQKAVVEVNEEGTVAAVVTGVIGGFRLSLVPNFEFKVDHPFVFFIRNRHTGAILFGGQVNHL